MKNNKGISAVVATVLIILITVAAVTIIWAAIIPMIRTQVDQGTVCINALTQITLENRGYTCYNDVKHKLEVQVGYGATDIGLKGIQFSIDTDGNTVHKTIEEIDELPITNSVKVLYVDDVAVKPDTVAIAAMIKAGNADTICTATDPIAVVNCTV